MCRCLSVRVFAILVVLVSAAGPASAQTQEGVSWANPIHATVNGSSIQKSGGCDNCPDAGATSQQLISSVGSSLRFTPVVNATAGPSISAGLAVNAGSPPTGLDIDYAFSIWPGNGWEIRELGVYKKDGTWTAGQEFKIVLDSATQVKYYVGSTLVHTSVRSTTPSYRAAVTLFNLGVAVNNATFGLPGGTSVPTSYPGAIIHRETLERPAVAPGGPPVGEPFLDPKFGSRLVRVTNAATQAGLPNRSYRVASNSHLAAWNTASTYFYVVSQEGSVLPFSFNAATMAATRVEVNGSPVVLPFTTEPQFSVADPNVIYGVGGSNNRTIQKMTFPALGTPQTVVNLDSHWEPGAQPSGYVGGVVSGGKDAEKVVAFYGGGCQDLHNYVLWYPVGAPTSKKRLNTTESKLDGVPLPTPLGFHLHSIAVDMSGRFVMLYSAANELTSCGGTPTPRTAEQVYVWDTLTDDITPVTEAMRPYGHDTLGFGYWINQECCTTPGPYDGAQWQFRALTDLANTKDLINPLMTPHETYWSDHSTWNNAQPTTLVPFISATTKGINPVTGWRAWDDEIIAVQTDVPAGQGATVWRIAHHHSDMRNESGGVEFWYQPMPNVSPDGKWALFHSNWQKKLGCQHQSNCTPSPSMYRQDVFLVCLTVGSCPGDGGTGGEQPVAWTNPILASVTGNSIQKTGGCNNCPDAGGVSQQQISASGSWVRFKPVVNATAGPSLAVGLASSPSAPPNISQINYGFSVWPNNTWEIRELGTYKTDGAWTAGAEFKIAIESGSVKYYVGGTLVRTTPLVSGSYKLAASLLNIGVSVENAHVK